MQTLTASQQRRQTRHLFLTVIGYLLLFLAVAMLSVALGSFAVHERSAWHFVSAGTTSSVVAVAMLFNAKRVEHIAKRHLFLLTTLCWLAICVFSALPFYLALPKLSFTNAWFETVSAITTTGSTVLSNLEQLPKGLLFWRALLQWIGGIGIIVMAIAILPALKIGGMKLFQTESSDISDKILPRSSAMSSAIVGVYLALTLGSALSYYVGGMSKFDAITHGMTSVATGGFSNYDASFGHFNDKPHLLWLASLWMTLAALPFLLFVGTLKGDHFALLKDPQVRTFALLIVIASVLLAGYQSYHADRPFWQALTHSTFNVVSVITTCGYASEDYSLWGGLAMIVFFYLTFSGGCSGSTSGGLKVFRTQLAGLLLLKQFQLLIHPNAVISQKYGSKKVNDELLGAVLSFCFIYFATIGVLALVLAGYGLDLVTSLTGAATAVSNVGPGLGDVIGPAGNFASLPDGAKWWLTFGMLLGRLEILTVLILFTPSYWRY